MSNVNKFSSPADLQAKFNAAMSALIALGKQAGLTASGELSDSELEAVAGGTGYGSSSGGGPGSRSSGGYGPSSSSRGRQSGN